MGRSGETAIVAMGVEVGQEERERDNTKVVVGKKQ